MRLTLLTFFILLFFNEKLIAQATETNVIETTGSVGIGTLSPATILHVETSGEGYSNSWLFPNGQDEKTPGISIINNNEEGKAVWLGAGTEGSGLFFDDAGPFVIGTNSKSSLQTTPGTGSVLMTILQDGRIGLSGISEPQDDLHAYSSVGIGNGSTGFLNMRYGGIGTGSEICGKKNGASMMAFGFNNEAPFSGTAGATNGRNIYFYDRQTNTYRGSIDGSGTWWVGSSGSNYGLKIAAPSGSVTGVTINSTGAMGIGTSSPSSNFKLDVNGNIYTNGKISIGETNVSKIQNYSLAVNGTAIFTKAIVRLHTTWPDYVFTKDYKLPSLTEVKTFIQQHQHLPDVPSASEIEKNGIDLGDTQSILLRKIEELTLYILNQEERINKLEATIKDNVKR